MRLVISIALAALTSLACGGCILPAPHTRVHAYGVTARVVDANGGKPVNGATIISFDQPGEAARSDKQGNFRLRPRRGWHFAYCVGPICLSLLPAYDITVQQRVIKVSAPGYNDASFIVSGFSRDDGKDIPAEVSGAYLKARELELNR